jgi:ParB-like chromosome segregation protein Spo0J
MKRTNREVDGGATAVASIAMPKNVEMWPVERLRPYHKNPRTHSAEQLMQIAASIIEFGWSAPILLDGSGNIVAGHGRWLAAQQLGLREVPVIQLPHLTDAQRRALIIADNKLTELGGWDRELLAAELQALDDLDFPMGVIGFDDDELRDLIGDDEPEEAPIPAPPETPVTRPGDRWLLGDHVLVCGDCTDEAVVQRTMAGERATLFATDPPYLVGYVGTNKLSASKSDGKDWSADYEDWDNPEQGRALYDGFIAAAVKHAITSNAAWYCWHASRRQALLEQCWIDAGAFVHQQVIWVKTRGVLTRSTYLWRHEPCLHGWLKGNRPYFHRQSEDPTSVWEVASSEVESHDHPTSKPTKLFEIPTLVHTRPGEICYEPFSGSGSQIIAAERTKRRCRAIEINPRFCDVAILRWQNATGKAATLDGDGRDFATISAERLAAPAVTE